MLPLVSLPAWATTLDWTGVPVLRASALAVQARARHADDADAHVLAEVVLRDPLLCLRVLASAAARQSPQATPVASVTAALVLTGIDPFFRDCATLPILEDKLSLQARQEALAVVARSRVAARIAAAFAIHRQDEDVEEVHLAALLHEVGEVLARYFAPDADPNADPEAAPPGLVSAALLRRWGLPEALRHPAHGPVGDAPRPRMVALAARIARHMEHGWSGPELLGDAAQAGQLLNLRPQVAASLVRRAAG